MKKNILKWGFASAMIVALVGCGEEKDQGDVTKPVVESDTIVAEDTLSILGPDLDPDMAYSVPTPNELFTIIKETGIEFDASILNSTDNVDTYTNKKIQALNFGIYSADLGFTSSYEIGTDALKYFAVIKKLGDDLDISNAFDETVFKQVEESIENGQSDSLLMLSNETYFQAYSYLEENERGSTLALIVLGGWLESLYIMTNLNEYEEGSALVDRIGEQKLTLENLMGFMMKYQEDEVTEVLEELADIEMIFWNLSVEEGKEVATEQKDGMYVLSGGGKIVVTEEEFNELKEKVSELRAEIVDGEL